MHFLDLWRDSGQPPCRSTFRYGCETKTIIIPWASMLIFLRQGLLGVRLGFRE